MKNAGLILISIFTKILGIFFLFPFLLSYFKKHRSRPVFWIMSVIILISFPLFYFFLSEIGGVAGFKAFSSGWVWNPGFYSFLWRGLEWGSSKARHWTQLLFLIYMTFLGMGSLIFFKKQDYQISNNQIWLISYLFFSGLIFFTPVYNAWYAIWFLIPAYLLNLPMGMAYGLASITCYGAYLSQDWLFLFEFLGHLFFPISLIQIYNSRERWVLKEV